MIRDYELGDLDKIELNEYSEFEYITGKEAFENILKAWHSFTVYNEKGIEAILCYVEYHPGCYKAFICAGKHISMQISRQIKRFIHRMAKEMNATRLETESQDCEMLNRWHRFLGFELEGTKRKFMRGRDYNVWGMVKWG
jgi:hypothetical protein